MFDSCSIAHREYRREAAAKLCSISIQHQITSQGGGGNHKSWVMALLFFQQERIYFDKTQYFQHKKIICWKGPCLCNAYYSVWTPSLAAPWGSARGRNSSCAATDPRHAHVGTTSAQVKQDHVGWVHAGVPEVVLHVSWIAAHNPENIFNKLTEIRKIRHMRHTGRCQLYFCFCLWISKFFLC